MSGLGEQMICSPWFHAAAGACVGVGVMILVLAKWWRKIFMDPCEKASRNSNDPTVRAIWDKINVMENRQVTLRTELPKELKEFVGREDLSRLEECQHRIEAKLDRFMEDCRKGNCAAGKAMR